MCKISYKTWSVGRPLAVDTLEKGLMNSKYIRLHYSSVERSAAPCVFVWLSGATLLCHSGTVSRMMDVLCPQQ